MKAIMPSNITYKCVKCGKFEIGITNDKFVLVSDVGKPNLTEYGVVSCLSTILSSGPLLSYAAVSQCPTVRVVQYWQSESDRQNVLRSDSDRKYLLRDW